MSLSLRSTTTFVPRVACYSTASYSTTTHQSERAPLYQDEPKRESEQDAGRSTKPEVVISSDSDYVESTGGHVRI
ncbi:hypothetical protein ZYGR_0AD06010 [Zygosaccharomyces rouxii]|uniref:Uncharacterized protein n=1 Tax=Zygosaccharomyces rouxii TaxID=4956 RepID=A0A1Q3A6X6_ZYGRO|nr:hypothetical protein ZYGR_0AD06010 [Zygosaccharomyces rouxii]